MECTETEPRRSPLASSTTAQDALLPELQSARRRTRARASSWDRTPPPFQSWMSGSWRAAQTASASFSRHGRSRTGPASSSTGAIGSMRLILPQPSGGDGHPDAAAGLGAVALDLALEVQRGDHRGLGDLGGDEVGRQQPGDLELDAVGVLRVERLRGPVVGGADEGAGLEERATDAGQLGEGVDLPRQVVQADGAAAGLGRAGAGADREETEVVVVRGALRLEEHRAPGDLDLRAEAEDVAVEGEAGVDVADVEDGVVEALDGHGGLLRSGTAFTILQCV